MSAKIACMPPPVRLTDEDLEIAEAACRGLVAMYRRRGDRKRVAELERMAESIGRARANAR